MAFMTFISNHLCDWVQEEVVGTTIATTSEPAVCRATGCNVLLSTSAGMRELFKVRYLAHQCLTLPLGQQSLTRTKKASQSGAANPEKAGRHWVEPHAGGNFDSQIYQQALVCWQGKWARI